MSRGEASFKLSPRPKFQSLLRKLGCIGVFLTLLTSALVLSALIALFQLKKTFKLLSPIPTEKLSNYGNYELVRPLFINRTEFDVLASIWIPAVKVNETNGNETAERVIEERVLWEGLLNQNVTFSWGTIHNVSLPVDLDLSSLWSLPDIRFYSLLASVIIVPKISTTPLGIARDADLSIDQAFSSISKGSGFPLNLSPLNNDHWIPDLGRELRSEIKKSALMSATTVPLLFLPPRNEEAQEFYLNTKIQIRVERQLGSFHYEEFLRLFENTTSHISSRCHHNLHHTLDDTLQDGCLTYDFDGPVQSYLRFTKDTPKFKVEGLSAPQEHLEKIAELLETGLSRMFFVPYLILQTSSLPRDLVRLSRNESEVAFNWTSDLRVVPPNNGSFSSFRNERSGQTLGQMGLSGRFFLNKGVTEDLNATVSRSDLIVWIYLSFLRGCFETAIGFLSILYFHTRATSVGISLPSVLFTSLSFFLQLYSHRSLLGPDRYPLCETIEHIRSSLAIFKLPWFILAFQQLCFACRFPIVRSKRIWGIFSLKKVPADHSERQNAREEGEVTMASRFGIFTLLVLILIFLKPNCFYLQVGGLGGLKSASSSLSLVLFALPQAGRLLGEIIQLHFNYRQQTFAGSFKITVIVQALRHFIQLLTMVRIDTRRPASSYFDLFVNSTSIALTAIWIYQARCYASIAQIRDQDQE